MMGIVANQVAEELSVTYKFPTLEDASYISKNEVVNFQLLGRNLAYAPIYFYGNQKSLEKLTKDRLTKSSMAIDSGGYKVTMKRELDDIGRFHYKITVENKYTFFFGEALSLLGLKETDKLKATTYVAGTDVLAYTTSVDTVYFVTGKVLDNNLIDSICTTIHTVYSWLTT